MLLPLMWLTLLLLVYSPLANMALEKVYDCQELKPLLQKVAIEGGFTLHSIETYKPFVAYWDGSRREIVLSLPRHPTISTMISSIVFELHNAHCDQRLAYLARLAVENKISREDYIRKVEMMEFKNWNNAYEILKRGVEQGIFPVGSTLPNRFSDFNRYLTVQQEAGHSAYIGTIYDGLRHQTPVRFY